MVDETRLRTLVDRLLERDRSTHESALTELGSVGDERVIPHLVDVLVVDAVANDWERFGFPETMRSRDPPRYLDLPDVRWPGVRDALAALSGVRFDSEYAWVEWETWFSQQAIDPLPGYGEWKRSLYRSFLPPVGGLLDDGTYAFDFVDLRWGNCDRSYLAALNEPALVHGESLTGDGDGARLDADDTVFGFVVDGTPVAVPRWLLFPHELCNFTVNGRPVSLTYCTLCNAPIRYDRRVDGEALTFGNSGLLYRGNKVMYDEETETLWAQHTGEPLGGALFETGARLDVQPITQTTWSSWHADHPETLVPTTDTGYGYDYAGYKGDLGIFRHYWEGDAVQPGVATADGPLDESAEVYGIDVAGRTLVFPVERVREDGHVVAELDGSVYVAVRDEYGDVRAFEAPQTPLEGDDGTLRDADGVRWSLEGDALVSANGRLPEVVGRHGLWFAFRLSADEPVVA